MPPLRQIREFEICVLFWVKTLILEGRIRGKNWFSRQGFIFISLWFVLHFYLCLCSLKSEFVFKQARNVCLSPSLIKVCQYGETSLPSTADIAHTGPVRDMDRCNQLCGPVDGALYCSGSCSNVLEWTFWKSIKNVWVTIWSFKLS